MNVAFARLETIKRSENWGARDKIDYLARLGRFSKKGGLLFGPVQILPELAPNRFKRFEILWAEADAAERYGQICALDVLIALPHSGVGKSDLLEIARSFAQLLADQFNVGVSFVIHAEIKERDALSGEESFENPHAHFLLTSREVTPEGLARRRIASLLPTCRAQRAGLGGMSVVDATPLSQLYQSVLENFFARRGLLDQIDLPAPQSQRHIGPVASVGVGIANASAIAARPDASAIFRKLDRIQTNQQVHHRNSVAVGNVETLLAHLSARPFTETSLKRLVSRFVDTASDAQDIVDAVLARSSAFQCAQNGVVSSTLVTKDYVDRENRIGQLVNVLVPLSAKPSVSAVDLDHIANFIGQKELQLSLVSLSADVDCGPLLSGLGLRGLKPVLVTHLAKSRPTPQANMRPLHWAKAFEFAADEIAVVDEADMLKPDQFETLFAAAVKSQAQIVLIRRPPRAGWKRNAILDAVAARVPHFEHSEPSSISIDLAISSRDYFQMAELLHQEGRCSVAKDRAGLVDLALRTAATAQNAGKNLFLLCPDAELCTRVLDRCVASGVRTKTGSFVPVDHSGPVLVLHTASHYRTPLLAQIEGRHFAIAVSGEEVESTSELARQLAFADQSFSALTFGTVALRLTPAVAKPEPGDLGAFEPFPQPEAIRTSKQMRPRSDRSVIDEMTAEIGVDFNDVLELDSFWHDDEVPNVSLVRDGIQICDDDADLDIDSS